MLQCEEILFAGAINATLVLSRFAPNSASLTSFGLGGNMSISSANIRVVLRLQRVMARLQSGLPYGAATYASPESSAWALMALCVCSASASPAIGGPATTGFRPVSNEKQERFLRSWKSRLPGGLLHFRVKRRNGRKSGLLPRERQRLWRQISDNLNRRSESSCGEPMKRAPLVFTGPVIA